MPLSYPGANNSDADNGEVSAEVKCSRAGCSERADFTVVWRNPKIHTDGRVKNWLACAKHVNFLREYLEARGMFLEVQKL